MKNALWQWLMPILKVGVAGGLVGYLWQQGKLDFAALSIMMSAPLSMTVAVGMFMLAYSLAALRWILLLRSQEIHLPFAWGQRVTYISLFSNTFLPGGGMAADALRLAYVARSAPTHRPEALLSLLVDRMIGFYAMLVITTLTIVANPFLIMGVGPLQVLAVSVIAVVVLVPPLTFVLYQIARRNPWLKRLISAPHPGKLGRIIRRLNDIIRLYGHSLPALIQAFGLSLASQSLLMSALVLVAIVMGIGALSPGEYAFSTSWAWLANYIPLTPGGIGVGEAAFDQVCRWIESAPSGAAYGTIYLVYRLLSVLAALPGLAAYLFSRNDINAEIRKNPALSLDQ